MIYANSLKAPKNKVIWGCAYSTNNTEKTMALRKKPVKGIIKDSNFYELKKNGEPKKSGVVHMSARDYADTETECIELYNQKVQKQIDFLHKLADSCKEDLIEIEHIENTSVQGE